MSKTIKIREARFTLQIAGKPDLDVAVSIETIDVGWGFFDHVLACEACGTPFVGKCSQSTHGVFGEPSFESMLPCMIRKPLAVAVKSFLLAEYAATR